MQHNSRKFARRTQLPYVGRGMKRSTRELQCFLDRDVSTFGDYKASGKPFRKFDRDLHAATARSGDVWRLSQTQGCQDVRYQDENHFDSLILFVVILSSTFSFNAAVRTQERRRTPKPKALVLRMVNTFNVSRFTRC